MRCATRAAGPESGGQHVAGAARVVAMRFDIAVGLKSQRLLVALRDIELPAWKDIEQAMPAAK